MSMNAYAKFSRYYDAMMHDVDYSAWAAYLNGFLKQRHAETVADVACGTGSTTIRLAQSGFHMLGIDQSADMLNVAQQKAHELGMQIPFICQDMTALSVHRPVDAILCCCDGVNYLTSLDDVSAFFHACHAALRPGGLLLFDISSAYKLERVIGNETFTEITDDYAYIWQNAFDSTRSLCQMDLCFFVKNDMHYDRFSERHVQRAHTVDELTELACGSGFAVRGVYEGFCLRAPQEKSERIQFVLEKEE